MASKSRPRTIALVGPYLSGKTTLLENILFATGAIARKGSTRERNSVGDASAEARERQMGVEVNIAAATYLEDRFTFLDCPGSIEFAQETMNAAIGADLVVFVLEPDAERAKSIVPLIRFADERKLPALIFLNKVDKFQGSIPDVVAAMQGLTPRRLMLRQIPIRKGEAVIGYVDLASGRAYSYKADEASERIERPAAIDAEYKQARFAMLERMADFDDKLMEKLLEDVDPENNEVYADIVKLVGACDIMPVMIGAGEHEHGVRRLLKAFRHDTPGPETAAKRLGLDPAAAAPVAQVLKTYNFPSIGKLSAVRLWQGTLAEGVSLNGVRPSGIFDLHGQQTKKRANAGIGEVVALGRLEDIKTGETLTGAKDGIKLPRVPVPEPVYALSVHAKNRADEVKLSSALAKLLDEDPSYLIEQSPETRELVLKGQGEIHLRVAVARLKNKGGLEVVTARPKVPYKEAIQRSVKQHGRHKRQSGGHGQFGDIHIEIKPLPRGSGFAFVDEIVGGVVPRNFIPAVDDGVREYLVKGPLGFPVVDVSVTLFDGSYHSVDSSEMAFKTAAQIAMREGMPKCGPVLLEPILAVEVFAPSEYTAKVNQLVSGRRGQLLGFEGRDGWPGWDVVRSLIPQSEMQDLIIELRSLTAGTGTYVAKFDHLQELVGRLADQVIQAQAQAASAA
ncbi:MAG: elongation factor G [Alphaproteobacteria bacterium]|nr:elongation factor G [Alphaproteobacteria bacterium]